MLSSESTETHRYTYAGGKLLREAILTFTASGEITNEILDFRYDNAGLPYALIYQDGSGVEEIYYYITNLQGDVMYMVDESGDEVASYEYDPYGKLTRTTGDMAETNPLRYRGYYYDNETSFYYLQSRYYDPAICRFINADGYASTGQGLVGYNMYVYCNNNPIIYADPTGSRPIWERTYGGVTMYTDTANQRKSEPYPTANAAAKAFSEEVFSSSQYIRHEYITEIYSQTINGVTTYNYTTPRAGGAHHVAFGYDIPRGTTLVAYAHTHVNVADFSGLDIEMADTNKIDIYVVGADLKLLRYVAWGEKVDDTIGYITPTALTEWQKAWLVGEFQASWEAHLATCTEGCQGMTWPTP